MVNPLLFPIKLLGWTAAGLALGVGWKLGCHLVAVAMGEKEFLVFPTDPEPPQTEQASTEPAPQSSENPVQ